MELDQTLHQLYLVTNYVATVRVARVVKFQESANTNGPGGLEWQFFITYFWTQEVFKKLFVKSIFFTQMQQIAPNWNHEYVRKCVI